jgi:type I restriction enzyme R subunit
MPPVTEEDKARASINNLLIAAGWCVLDADKTNIMAGRGVAIREFPLPGHGFADYLLYIDGKAAAVIEAKKEGVTLTGVETQADKYSKGLPQGLPRWGDPLPFSYQSTGVETRFTNGLDPAPRSRSVFAFHKPETLADFLDQCRVHSVHRKSDLIMAAEEHANYGITGTLLARLHHIPALIEEGLWPAQITAIKNLEQSIKENRPRALIQMATGAGKTFTAISFIYRLIKFAGARRILFLVDRGNLGDQALKEFQRYTSPYNNFKFTEEYIVQRLTSNTLDTTARVCISTIQRMYSMLKDKDLPEDLEEETVDKLGGLFKEPEPIEYNPSIPIETFDIIVTDECHRSIYNLWAQVLEYFDAYLIGLTATPSKQTFGFFNQNLVMEYNHEMAVADGVNVNYDVYRIRTQITEAGSKVEAGYSVQIQERDTRKKRWEQLDELQSVTPDAQAKDHFVIVDAVGVCEQDKTDSRPMEQKPTVSFEKLLQSVAFGNTEDEVLSSLAGRLARMAHRLKPEDDKQIRALSDGLGVKDLSHRIVAALDPDRHIEQAKTDLGIAPDDDRPIPEQALQAARQKIVQEAVKPLYDPKLREAIDEIKKKNESSSTLSAPMRCWRARFPVML